MKNDVDGEGESKQKITNHSSSHLISSYLKNPTDSCNIKIH